MIEVTDIILNFHRFIISLSKSMLFLDYDRGSDAWEELTESGFKFLVLDIIQERFGISINAEYEFWQSHMGDDSLIVTVRPGSKLLASEEGNIESHERVYVEIPNIDYDVSLSFIEFGLPGSIDFSDYKSDLNYVIGVDVEGKVYCAELKSCQFFVSKSS